LTAAAPALWPFILSLLILGVAVALPNGMLSAGEAWRKASQSLANRRSEEMP
jgi:hypothetical protein